MLYLKNHWHFATGLSRFCIVVLISLCSSLAVAEHKLEEMVVLGESKAVRLAPDFYSTKDDFNHAIGGQSLLDDSEFRKGSLSGQEDIFKLTPGVWVSTNNGADDAFISIRGSGLSTQSFGNGLRSLQDGLPLGRIDNGTSAQIIDVLAYDFVEVYRGSNAMKLGAAQLGGAVNYVSNTGYTSKPLQARFEHGAFDYARGQISSGQVIGDLDYYVSGNILTKRGYRDHQTTQNNRLSSNLGYVINKNIETRFYYSFNSANADLAGSLRKATFRNDPKADGFFVNSALTNASFDTDRNWDDHRLANKTSFSGDDWQLDVGVYANYTLFDHLPVPFTGIIDNTYRQVGTTTNFSWDRPIGGFENNLKLGVTTGFSNDILTRFQHQNNGKTKGAQVLDARGKANQVEVFFEDILSVTDKFDVVAGLQYIYAQRIYEDRTLAGPAEVRTFFGPFANIQPGAVTGDQSFDQSHEGLNPRLGVSYEAATGKFLFANVARSMGIASITELNNAVNQGLTPADVQTAWTTEIGTRGETEHSFWDVTLFRSWIDGELLAFSPPKFGGTFSVISNVESTVHQGLEFGAGYSPFNNILFKDDHLQLDLIYNWSDFSFDGDAVFKDARLPKIPQHAAYLQLEYQGPHGFYIGPNFRYVGERKSTLDGTGGDDWVIESHVLMNLRGGFKHENGFSAFVEVKNLLDKTYVQDVSVVETASATSSAAVTTGDGRGVFIGLEFQY